MNMQNIPSKSHDIRHMFRATPELLEDRVVSNNSFTIQNIEYVEVEKKGWIHPADIVEGDIISTDEGEFVIDNVTEKDYVYTISGHAIPSK